jgi:hypothetical protein
MFKRTRDGRKTSRLLRKSTAISSDYKAIPVRFRPVFWLSSATSALALGLALPGGLIIPEVTALISNGSAILASLNGIRPILRYQ